MLLMSGLRWILSVSHSTIHSLRSASRQNRPSLLAMQKVKTRTPALAPDGCACVRWSSSSSVAEPHDGPPIYRKSSTPSQNQSQYKKILVKDGGICPKVEAVEYAVRGELVLRAEALATRLKNQSARNELQNEGTRGDKKNSKTETNRTSNPESKLPFDRITYCNIGNPQSVGQVPVTFIRQVLAAVMCPDFMLNNSTVSSLLPDDVQDRARLLLSSSHGMGAYSESKGLKVVRERVAKALARRDGGVPADPETIFLTNGASEAVKILLSLLIRSPSDGILIPIPQYPLYSATLQSLGGRQVGYFLNEDEEWSLSVSELERQLNDAKANGTEVRALCVINPGNPTGSTLSRGNVVEIVRFCDKNNLLLMADEVYQNNVYVPDLPFVSFKQVVNELGSPVELASFHSVSKGVLGECGLRGGFVELHNMDAYAVDMMYKCMSISLCANIPGQVAIDLMMNPPVPGDSSYELFQNETRNTYESLRRKSQKLASAFNNFQGVSCNPPQGAMYLFPQVRMPLGALKKSKEMKLKCPDILYCRELLEETGICVVPGSGFGQVPGTIHFRTTFLPPEDQIDDVIRKMDKFHRKFMAKYSS